MACRPVAMIAKKLKRERPDTAIRMHGTQQTRVRLNIRLYCLFLAHETTILFFKNSNGTYLPKSRGSELRDISFSPRMVRFFN